MDVTTEHNSGDGHTCELGLELELSMDAHPQTELVYPPDRPWTDLQFKLDQNLIVDVPWDFNDEALDWAITTLGPEMVDYRFYIPTNGAAMRYQFAFADEEAMSRFILTWM